MHDLITFLLVWIMIGALVWWVLYCVGFSPRKVKPLTFGIAAVIGWPAIVAFLVASYIGEPRR